jgi:hypothetical protein
VYEYKHHSTYLGDTEELVDTITAPLTFPIPPAPPASAPPTIETVRADLANLRAIMEKDLFWRRVGVGVAVFGTLIGLAKLTDIILAMRRRRTEST